MTTVEHGVVAELGQAIAQRIGEPRYKFWFQANTKFQWDDDVLTVGAPNRFFQEWLESKFVDEVRSAASAVLGRPMRVRFVIDADLFRAARQAEGSEIPVPVELTEAPETAERKNPAPTRRSPLRQRHWRRLGDFVVGPCNRLAHAAALSVVEAPGQGANPLVIHGPVGVGKTHLLEGIYAATRKANAEARVCYAPAEEFTNRFVQSMRLGKLGSFRKHYRDCDLLLMDDLNFLAGKRATQEEFLHTFDALFADNRQVVVRAIVIRSSWTSICRSWPTGCWRACWSVTPPDSGPGWRSCWKAGRGEEPFADGVLRLLADNLRGNVRELEARWHSVRHYARVHGKRG